MPPIGEPCGGDPPCWSHLFEEFQEEVAGPNEAGTVNLVAVARSAAGRGPASTRRSEDLNVNLIVFGAGEGVAEHRNAEVDVPLVGVTGEGVVTVDERSHPLQAGHAVLVRKDAPQHPRARATLVLPHMPPPAL